MTALRLLETPEIPAASPDLHWVTSTSCPPDWQVQLEHCGGGFFHSPLGLLAGAPAGQPLFVQLVSDGRVMGIGAGVRHGCGLGLRPGHVYFPTLPALLCPGREDAALVALVGELRRLDAVEVVFDSFDARWRPSRELGAAGTRQRTEHVVALKVTEEAQLAACSRNHRRHATNGAHDRWTFDTLGSDEARALLAEVQDRASERAAGRGNRVLVEPPAIMAIAVTRLADPWGAAAFGAWDRDTLLAVALVGWANRRAYYICGGSTPAGASRHAPIWLHLKIMASLAAAGVRSYNLGGTAAAAEPGDKEHGLSRFKRGFGADVRPCAGARWALRRAHARAHQIVAGIMGAATP